MTFQVEWMRFYKSSLKNYFILLFIVAGFGEIMAIIRKGFVMKTLLMLIGVLLAGYAALCVILLPLAWSLKIYAITINKHELTGRSLWGRKKKIPLSDITDFKEYSSHGMQGI